MHRTLGPRPSPPSERHAWRKTMVLPVREPAALDRDRFHWAEAVTCGHGSMSAGRRRCSVRDQEQRATADHGPVLSPRGMMARSCTPAPRATSIALTIS
jgi:hypothetical protein